MRLPKVLERQIRMKTKEHITVNVMAPLTVGDPRDLNSAASREAWDGFERRLAKMKALQVDAVTTDVWWGLIEAEEGKFDWSYYDQLAKYITDAGLKWIPILSFHQCGGNVGDNVFVEIPKWVFPKIAAKASGNARDVKFVSEQGNESNEYVSFWATHLVLDNYVSMMKAFRDHFASYAPHIVEINISLGPSGELRYPSYNSHDTNTDFPNRGALQCYSKLAVDSFRNFALAKYTDLAGVDKAWGTKTATGQVIQPPSNPEQFLNNGQHKDLQYGRDFFDWYSDSLIDHGRTVMRAAQSVFGAEDSPMKGIDLGAKVPGIHWQTGKRVFSREAALKVVRHKLDKGLPEIGKHATDAVSYKESVEAFVDTVLAESLSVNFDPDDHDGAIGGEIVLGSRFPELAAGLIRTSRGDWQSDQDGRGYRPLIKLFAELQSAGRVVLHFTCLEKADGEDQDRNARSVARSLVRWVGAEAHQQGVPLKGENAVSWSLPVRKSWHIMQTHLDWLNKASRAAFSQDLVPGNYYQGVTILRMDDVADGDVARDEMGKLTRAVHDDQAEQAAQADADARRQGEHNNGDGSAGGA